MTVVVQPRVFLGAPEIIEPWDNTTETFSPDLIWDIIPALVEQDIPAHFQVQVADTPDMSSLVIDAISFIDQTNFEFEITPGNWIAFPSTGLDPANFHSRLRYRTHFITRKWYYWRARTLQQLPL